MVYQELNWPEPMTFVYRAEGADAPTAINRALDTPASRLRPSTPQA